MADKTIGDLPAAAAIYDDDLFLLEQSGEAKNLRAALYKAYLQGFVDAASAASEEAAAALAGVKDAINNIPEGAATPIVNDLTTGGASMALSAEMGKELGKRPNPNLLDNWYFANPVNQRGQTEYSGSGYSVDRWRTNFSGDTVSVVDGYIKNVSNSTSVGWHFHQILKINSEMLSGKIVTASVLVRDYQGERLKPVVSFRDAADVEIKALTLSTMGSGTLILTGEVPAGTVYIKLGLYASSGIVIGDYVTINAIKLELGAQQTLAHQDADGNWVLNEIPDYNEQLLRCCMSTADSTDTYANNKLTAAAVNAVPLDGRKAMTGDLVVVKSNIRNIHSVNASADIAFLQYYDPTNAKAANIGWNDKQLYYQPTHDMSTWSKYTILHTGNKPSGSYTGNGDATARTIDTGGVGEVIMVRSGGTNACMGIITYKGGFGVISGSLVFLPNTEAMFTNGVLTISTNSLLVNGNGMPYYYQVL